MLLQRSSDGSAGLLSSGSDDLLLLSSRRRSNGFDGRGREGEDLGFDDDLDRKSVV